MKDIGWCSANSLTVDWRSRNHSHWSHGATSKWLTHARALSPSSNPSIVSHAPHSMCLASPTSLRPRVAVWLPIRHSFSLTTSTSTTNVHPAPTESTRRYALRDNNQQQVFRLASTEYRVLSKVFQIDGLVRTHTNTLFAWWSTLLRLVQSTSFGLYRVCTELQHSPCGVLQTD